MLADLHCHTIFSLDTCSSLSMILQFCRKKGIECLAVTDHNVIEGALRLKEMNSVKVIVGEEVATTEGEIIGLFLKTRILPNQTPEETITAIREQGGLVYLPHPFAGLSRRKRWSLERLAEIVHKVDIVEVFNARNLREEYNAEARRFAYEHGLPAGAGSDAHTPWEIGSVMVEMDDFETPQEFIQHLKQAKITGRRSSKMLRAVFNCYTRKLLRRVIK